MRLTKSQTFSIPIFTVLLMLIVFAGPAAAEGGMTLGPGQIILPEGINASDKGVMAPRLYWRNVTIAVANDGTFSYSGQTSVSDAWTETYSVSNRENTYSGSYDVSINGIYDSEDKTFSGEFTIRYETTHDYKSVSTKAGLEFTGQGHHIVRTGTFSGKAAGTMDLGGSSATITFTGNDSYSESGTDDSGKPMKEQSGNTGETQNVAFTVQGEITGQPYDQLSAEDIEKAGADEKKPSDIDITIDSIYGDVTVSDPAVKRGFWSLCVKALGDLTGWDRDPEPLRVRIDPEKGMKMTQGFQIKTGDGRAVIRFKDGTRFIISEASTVTFKGGGIHLDTGNFLAFYVKKGKKVYMVDRRGKYGIIGTMFEVTSGETGSVLKVYEGVVEAEAIKGGAKQQVNTGEVIKIDDAGLGDLATVIGATNPDFAALEQEVIDSELGEARMLGLLVAGVLVFVLAALAGATLFVVFRRRKKQASKPATS